MGYFVKIITALPVFLACFYVCLSAFNPMFQGFGLAFMNSTCQHVRIQTSAVVRINTIMSGSAMLKCFKTWLTNSAQSYTNFITAVTVVHRASSPYVLTR